MPDPANVVTILALLASVFFFALVRRQITPRSQQERAVQIEHLIKP